MYVLFKRAYLRTKIIIYFNILFILLFYKASIPVNLLKIASIIIAMVIFTTILEMHSLNCEGTKWRISNVICVKLILTSVFTWAQAACS